MIPHVFLLLPLFLIIQKMGLINTFTSLVITNSTFALPFSVWMLKGYFDTIPRDLEEAARIDGCTHVGAMWRVIMPLSAPGIAAVGLYTFIVSWQEYMFALTFARTTEMRTLPVGISLMLGDTRVLWGRLMASSVLVTIPVAIAFIYLQKHLVQGLTAGAVKG
jgi:multiple sugar transport system permease protein